MAQQELNARPTIQPEVTLDMGTDLPREDHTEERTEEEPQDLFRTERRLLRQLQRWFVGPSGFRRVSVREDDKLDELIHRWLRSNAEDEGGSSSQGEEPPCYRLIQFSTRGMLAKSSAGETGPLRNPSETIPHSPSYYTNGSSNYNHIKSWGNNRTSSYNKPQCKSWRK